MKELDEVEEIDAVYTKDDCNDRLRTGWKLIKVDVGMRRLHHVPPKGDNLTAPYAFDVPYQTYIVARYR